MWKGTQLYFPIISRNPCVCCAYIAQIFYLRPIWPLRHLDAYIPHMDSIDKQLLVCSKECAYDGAGNQLSIEPILKSGEQTSPKIGRGWVYLRLSRTGKRRTFGPDCSGLCSGATDRHGQENSQEFNRILSTSPEIISAWTLTGEADYLLRVYCLDLRISTASYMRFC